MKKISVKHYLNTKLKPEIDGEYIYYPMYVSIIVNSKNIKRRSHGIELNISKEDLTSEDIIKKIDYEKDLFTRIIQIFLKDRENNNVNRNYLYFLSNKGYNSKDEFINLLNSYIDFYSFSIFEAVAQYCIEEINNEIYKKIAECFNLEIKYVKHIFDYNPNVAGFNTEKFLLNNLSCAGIELLVLKERLRSFLSPYNLENGYDIPYIDWMQNRIQDKLQNFLKTYKRNTEYYLPEGFDFTDELINKYLNLIDEIVKSDNYTELTRNYLIF